MLTATDGGVFEAEPWRSSILSFATTRQVRPAWQMIFLRGVGCNWLVCIGCFIAAQGQDLTAKILGLYWPIFAFVSLGFDHVVSYSPFDQSTKFTCLSGRKHVLHADGDLVESSSSHHRPICLERNTTSAARKHGRWMCMLCRVLLPHVFAREATQVVPQLERAARY